MTMETELKREGIKVVKPVDTLTINAIAKKVSEKLVKAFPEQNLNSQELFIKLSRIQMYIADMPTGVSKAKYYYRNNSIYFNRELNLSYLDVYAMHECIHSIQELRDEKNNLLQLGLCDFTNSRLPGIALNEAAVQLMSCKALDVQPDIVKYFDITLPTYSPSHYALECNLINQMAYITGDYALYNSTLYSNDTFKNKFIALTSKQAYHTIEKQIDSLMDLEDLLSQKSALLENIEDTDKAISKIINHMNSLRLKIQQQFLKIQDLILTSYFDTNFHTITTLEQMDTYRKRLYNYKDLIGTTQNYTFFNDYYIQKMADLEAERNRIENSLYTMNPNMSLIPNKHHIVIDLFQKLKRLFIHNQTSVYEKENRTK